MNKPNVDLLDLTLKTIQANPEQWRQASWRTAGNQVEIDEKTGRMIQPVTCNTAFCFAGWAVQLGSETTPMWNDRVWLWAEPEDQTTALMVCARDRAQRLLGITEDQAEKLFESENRMHDIEHIVEEIKEDADE